MTKIVVMAWVAASPESDGPTAGQARSGGERRAAPQVQSPTNATSTSRFHEHMPDDMRGGAPGAQGVVASGSALQQTDLPQEADLIVEELLLDDLAVLPARDRAELQLERPAGGRVHLAAQILPRPDHPP